MARPLDRLVRLRLLVPLALVLAITAIGTAGYVWLGRSQGASFLDALFMTIITITTIGYGEVIRLDGWGRVFTMVIAVTGVGSLFYTFGVMMDGLLSSRLLDPHGERRMQRMIQRLSNHVIIAGLGRVGKQAAVELGYAGVPFVIVDPKEEAESYATQRGYLFLLGDATDDMVLDNAGIQRARGLITASGDDASNLFIVLSARALRPDLHIVSRAYDDKSVAKLLRAGANRAISPYAIGGRRLAHLILSPTVVDFFDTVMKRGEESLNLEDINVKQGDGAIGQSLAALRAREETGASVLVIFRENRVIPNPAPSEILAAGDRLLAMGTVEQLDKLESLVSRGS